ncbi:MAG: hypothetical protein IPM64_02930 [Phycisphaerales bacterium]|nr:hypothetical protein [Phycisphaerales bacterium]
MPFLLGFVQPEVAVTTSRSAVAARATPLAGLAAESRALRVSIHVSGAAAATREARDEAHAVEIAAALLEEFDGQGASAEIRLERAIRSDGPRFDPSRVIAGERGGWTDVTWQRVEEWSFDPAQAGPIPCEPVADLPAPEGSPAAANGVVAEALDRPLPAAVALSLFAKPQPLAANAARSSAAPSSPPAFRGYGWQAAGGLAALLATWFVAWALLVR